MTENPFARYREIEFGTPEEIRQVQTALLREHVVHCLAHSPYYRRVLADWDGAADLTPDRLADLPFTEKSDLERCNDEFLAAPPREVADIVFSSGTTGQTTRMMYSARDLERLAWNERQSFTSLGMTSDDVVMLTCTLDRCFVAGLAYFLGARALGAATVRSGLGSLEGQAQVMERIEPTVLIGVPTFLRKLGRHLAEQGRSPRAMKVRRLVCIGEPLRDRTLAPLRLAEDLEELWGARAYSTYASSEIVTSFCECEARCGGHLHPDLAIVEIVDEQGRVVAPGVEGEVTVTPLAVEAMPLIRFKTGDISLLTDEPCVCGRRSARLGPILGRKGQMMKVRGTTLYPQAIFNALNRVPGVTEYYVRVGGRDRLSDEVTVHVAGDARLPAQEAVAALLQAALRVRPAVVVEPEAALRARVYDAQSRKPVRFFDERDLRATGKAV
jgi:phenylacetate-CoA ligase